MSVFGLNIEYGIGDELGQQSVQKFSVSMERLADNISDFSKFVFPRVMRLFEEAVEKQFTAKGSGPVAGAWKQLTPKYQAWKEVHFPGQPILQLSGALRTALTAESDGNAYRKFDATTLDFGTISLPYASFHQIGNPFMPSRPPFDFGSDFESSLKKEMQLGIIDAARDAQIQVTE